LSVGLQPINQSTGKYFVKLTENLCNTTQTNTNETKAMLHGVLKVTKHRLSGQMNIREGQDLIMIWV